MRVAVSSFLTGCAKHLLVNFHAGFVKVWLFISGHGDVSGIGQRDKWHSVIWHARGMQYSELIFPR